MAAKKTAEKPTQANPMAAFNPMAPQVWQEIMTESARFMTERLQKDMATQQAMLTCKSPAELLQLQAEFFRNAMTDYSEEAARIFSLMSRAGGVNTARDYDDVPL